jgi:transcriptional regulator with XRE-family HTH domain
MEVEMKNLATLLKENLKDKDFEKKYHRNETFFRLADEILLLRKRRKLTQKELAEKIGTTQAVVSRLENASVKATLESIVKLAEALDAIVDIRLVPLEEVRKADVGAGEQLNSQKQLNALEGIVYFHEDQAKEETPTWIEPETLSSLLSISGKPSLMPLSKSKARQYA